MPRLTTTRYLAIHTVLHRFWHERHGHPLQYLRPEEQWLIHDYLRISEDLTDAELLEHRARVTKERPSLPAAAGKALKTLERLDLVVVPAQRRRGESAKPVIFPLVRPEIDHHKFARALLLLAEEHKPEDDSLPGLPRR
jgi:hypothetical protein